MSDLRDFIQRCDHTSIGLYLVEYDRMAEQLEAAQHERSVACSWAAELAGENRVLKEQLEALRGELEEEIR